MSAASSRPKRSTAAKKSYVDNSYLEQSDDEVDDTTFEPSLKNMKVLCYDPIQEIRFLKKKVEEERLRRREVELEYQTLKAERQDLCNRMNRLEAQRLANTVPVSMLPILQDAMSKGLNLQQLTTAAKPPVVATPQRTASAPKRAANARAGKTPGTPQTPTIKSSQLLSQGVGKEVVVGNQRYVIQDRVTNGVTMQMLIPVKSQPHLNSMGPKPSTPAAPLLSSPATGTSGPAASSSAVSNAAPVASAETVQNSVPAVAEATVAVADPDDEELPLGAPTDSLETPESPDPSNT